MLQHGDGALPVGALSGDLPVDWERPEERDEHQHEGRATGESAPTASAATLRW